MMSLSSPVTELRKVLQNVEHVEWFGVVRDHPRSLAMLPFDGAHMISYSSSTETKRLYRTVFEIRQVICQNVTTSTYPTGIWCPRWGDPVRISKRFLTPEN